VCLASLEFGYIIILSRHETLSYYAYNFCFIRFLPSIRPLPSCFKGFHSIFYFFPYISSGFSRILNFVFTREGSSAIYATMKGFTFFVLFSIFYILFIILIESLSAAESNTTESKPQPSPSRLISMNAGNIGEGLSTIWNQPHIVGDVLKLQWNR